MPISLKDANKLFDESNAWEALAEKIDAEIRNSYATGKYDEIRVSLAGVTTPVREKVKSVYESLGWSVSLEKGNYREPDMFVIRGRRR